MLSDSKPGKSHPKTGISSRSKWILFFASIILLVLIFSNLAVRKTDFTFQSGFDKPLSINSGMQKRDSEKGKAPAVPRVKLYLEYADGAERVRVVFPENQDDKNSTSYNYEWFRNKKPFGANSSIVTGFAKGDTIDVKITPFRDTEFGQPTYLTITIVHISPKIVENKMVSLEGDLLTYQVKAVDPDGGVLSYALQNAPRDMTIDSRTGTIKWLLRANDSGSHNFDVIIKNSDGLQTVYPLKINLDKPEK
jgi:hypothetical protein